jgi:hypothetical protein
MKHQIGPASHAQQGMTFKITLKFTLFLITMRIGPFSKCENRSGFQIGCQVRAWAVFKIRFSLGVGAFNPVLVMVVISGSRWLVFSPWVKTAQHRFQPLIPVFGLFRNQRTVGLDETLQNFIYKHTVNLENV